MTSGLRVAIAAALVASTAAPPAIAATVYADRASFAAQLDASITDGYDAADYGPGFTIRSDAAMSAVKGETRYFATGFPGANYTFSEAYCAGCNGSFRLDFSSTSIGTNLGVFGVGVDYFNNGTPGYIAFVTYGDGSSENISLDSASFSNRAFLGLTSSNRIYTIAFGLPNGDATQNGNFGIDNLTIGSAVSAGVPEPATWGLMILGFGMVGGALRRRRSVAAQLRFG